MAELGWCMSSNKDFSLYFEVVCTYHPTEFDKTGCDGMYIKEVKKIEPPEELTIEMWTINENVKLHEQLDVAMRTLQEISDPPYDGYTYQNAADVALAEIERIGKEHDV